MKKKKSFIEKYGNILLILSVLFTFGFVNYVMSSDPELANLWNEAWTPFGLGNSEMNFKKACLESNATIEGKTCIFNKNESSLYRVSIGCDEFKIQIYTNDKIQSLSLPKKYEKKCIILIEEINKQEGK